MKVAIITSFLALGTGLTGVIGAPMVVGESALATRDDVSAPIAARGADMITERDEERKKKHHHKNPTWCGAPFCAVSRLFCFFQVLLSC